MDAARDGRGRPFPYAKHRTSSSAWKSPPQNQTPSFTPMTRSLSPEVLLLVPREPSPYQRHTSPQFVRPRPAVSQNMIPAVARVAFFLTRDAPSSFSLTLHEGAFISSPLCIRDTVISGSFLLSLFLTKCTFLWTCAHFNRYTRDTPLAIFAFSTWEALSQAKDALISSTVLVSL